MINYKPIIDIFRDKPLYYPAVTHYYAQNKYSDSGTKVFQQITSKLFFITIRLRFPNLRSASIKSLNILTEI